MRLALSCCFAILGCLAASAQVSANALLWPSALAYDNDGNLYIADAGHHQILEATLGGVLQVVAGDGRQGFSGDGGSAVAAALDSPQGLAIGGDGTLYIADTANARIRAVAGGIIRTVAGTGQHAYSGDGASPLDASFRAPAAMAMDAAGDLLVCDPLDQRVRRIDLRAGGLVTTLAGTGLQGFSGDGGPASSAQVDTPRAIVVGADGRVFLADTHNQRVRVVSAAGTVSTYAGTGVRGFGGDGGPALAALLSDPRGLTVALDGTLWIADTGNERIRQVAPDGTVTTVAGIGREGSGADGEAASTTMFRTPRDMALSAFGQVAIADTLNGVVRVLTAANTLYRPAALAANRGVPSVLPSMASPSVYGTLPVTVRVVGLAGTAQGSVSLGEAGGMVASATLVNGSVTINAGSLPAGMHSLAVSYGGDGLNAATTSASVVALVVPLAIVARADSVTSVYGATLPTMTGTLEGVLNADAGQVTANFTVSGTGLLPVGTYPITATLSGSRSADYTVQTAPNSGSLTITQASTVTSLTGVTGAFVGIPLRLTAQVASGTTGQPSGAVQFADGGAVIATGALANGSASLVTSALTAGQHQLTAIYTGDGNFRSSSSASQTVTLAAVPDFTLSTGSQTSLTVAVGASATYSLLVTAAPAPFTGIVTLAVSGLPSGATAVFSPTQVVPGSTSAGVVLTVQAPATLADSSERGKSLWFAGCVLLGFSSMAKRRNLRWMSLLLFSCMVLSGCGARTASEGSGVTTKTYPLQVTGSATNLAGVTVVHTANLSLVVEQ